MCGFSRRFDASYRDAFQRLESIGTPSVFRSQTCDMLDPTGFFVQYAQFSGGIFVDCSIHDIDLALWFLGKDSVLKSITASGITAVEPDLRKFNDVDNGIGIVEFWDDKFAYFFCSRMMAAGQHDMTEILGPKGKLVVNGHPQANLVEVHAPGGVVRELPQNYYGRFEPAFVTMSNEFTAACLDGTPLPFELSGASTALEIGTYLQESLNSGQKINFDKTGRRIA